VRKASTVDPAFVLQAVMFQKKEIIKLKNKIIIYLLLLAGDDAVPEKEESSPAPPSSERQTGRTGRKERTGGTGGTGRAGGTTETGETRRTAGRERTGRRTGSGASARTPSSQIRYIHFRNLGLASSMPFTTFSGREGSEPQRKKTRERKTGSCWQLGGGGVGVEGFEGELMREADVSLPSPSSSS
jgi:hypothetical protein